MDRFAEAGALLVREHNEGVRFHSLSESHGLRDVADAYAVQDEYVRLMQASGRAAAGYKIGLTSKTMQAMCGIAHPIAGVMHSDVVHQSGVSLNLSQYGRLGLEFEIAVRIGKDVEPGAKLETIEQLADHVRDVCAAVEVVDDRHADYAILDPLTLIADNSWNAGIVLGEFRADWSDLENCVGRVHLDGQPAGEGSGRDVLGHPLQPLLWLTQHLAAKSLVLPAGAIVTTGSMVRTVFPENPCQYRFEVEGIGSVEVNVTA